jgi:chromosomal replication initiator protein
MRSLNDIWELTLAELNKDISDMIMSIWIRTIFIAEFKNQTVTLMCENTSKRAFVENNYKEKVLSALSVVLDYEPKINYVTPEEYIAAAEEAAAQSEPPFQPTQPTQQDQQDQPTLPKSRLTPKEAEMLFEDDDDTPPVVYMEKFPKQQKQEYTFETFIVGNSNKFAHAACFAVANNPAREYNPLFIYGASGLGKTHLLYAISNKIISKYPETNIIYVKGDEFTNQMIEAIGTGSTQKFREKYRGADVLLIDDIQFIAGKDSTQEEFFHTFNALYEDEKQIIMTSDRPPRDIKTLEDRLKTRFEWGLIADVQPPDFELRIAIMRNKAQRKNTTVPDDVLDYLAENLRSNVRQLEGAVKKIAAQSYLNNEPITLELATDCTIDVFSGNEPVSVTVDKIIAQVAKKYGVDGAMIRGPKRTREITGPRHIAVYIIRKLTEMSLPNIAKIFGRDHTTIMASLDKVESDLKANISLEFEINDIIKEIRE